MPTSGHRTVTATPKERISAPDTLQGKPDGPYKFIEELGAEVPTYVNPRLDLLEKSKRGFPRLTHHVPPSCRGPYKPEWMAPKHFSQYGHGYRTDHEGYALCHAEIKQKSDGTTHFKPRKCERRAVNRCPFCQNHGGALHPADRKPFAETKAMILKAAQINPEKLSRPQKFMAGVMELAALSDEEVTGGYVLDEDGRRWSGDSLTEKFRHDLISEMVRRSQRTIQQRLPDVLNVMYDIAMSDYAEPADRIKAAQWYAERTIGKTPDVVLHGKADTPLVGILGRIEAGARSEYRKQAAISSQANDGALDVDSFEIDDDLEPDDLPGEGTPVDVGDSGQDRIPVSHVRDSGDNRRPGQRSEDESVRGSGPDQRPQWSDELELADGPIHSGDTGPVDDGLTEAQRAKASRERIKKARNRRFAGRLTAGLKGEPKWLLDFRKLKSGRHKVKIYQPEEQTQAIVDRIQDRIAQGG